MVGSSGEIAGVKQVVGGLKTVVRGPTFVRDHPDHAILINECQEESQDWVLTIGGDNN